MGIKEIKGDLQCSSDISELRIRVLYERILRIRVCQYAHTYTRIYAPQNTCFSFFKALSIVKVCSLTIHDSTQHNRKSIITANIRVEGSRPLVLLESLQNKQSSCSFSRDSQLPVSTQNSANKINILPTKEPTPLCQLSNVSTRNVYHHVSSLPNPESLWPCKQYNHLLRTAFLVV